MSLVINSNIPSVTAQRHLAESRSLMETSMERLASGKRINSAMDDAAGLAITHKIDAKVAGLNQATRNANDGISMLQTAEGALEEVGNILTRLKELAVQSGNGTYSSTDRTALDAEFDELVTEVTRISDQTNFNDIDVIGASANLTFLVGDVDGDEISVVTMDMASTAIGTGSGAYLSNADISTQSDAQVAIAIIDNAIADVDSYRSTLGSVENRLDHTVSNLMNRVENQSAARSRIEDADFAVESANLAKAQVLQQAGTAMLAQANQSGQNVLALIQ